MILSQVIGRGSYSEVRMGRAKHSCQKVAIKVSSKSDLKTFQAKKNIVSEIQILKQISHPRIVKMLDVAEDEHNVYIIMEYVEGVSL